MRWSALRHCLGTCAANSQFASANLGIAAKKRSTAMALAASSVSRVTRPRATSHSLWLQGLAWNSSAARIDTRSQRPL